MATLTDVIALVLGPAVLAAVIAGIFTVINERKKQFREKQITVAGDVAGDAMSALAQLRHYRPTKRRGHRNEQLHTDVALRKLRADAVDDAIDRLRPLRGRVWLTFPGRSSVEVLETTGPQTTADWADHIVGVLQRMQRVCQDFWTECDTVGGTDPESRAKLEFQANEQYRSARTAAWRAINNFTDSALARIG